MRKSLSRIFLVFLFLGAVPALLAQGQDDFPSLFRFIQEQSPRLEGAAQEKAVLARLEEIFRSAKLDIQKYDFSQSTGAHSFSSSLAVKIPGKKTDELLIVAPVNTDKTKTNNAGIAWAVQMALEAQKKAPPALTLTFLFLGAERGQGRAYPLGSQQFLSDYYPDGPAAVIYLDFDQPSDQAEILLDSGASIAPYWMTQGLLSSLQDQGFRGRLGGTHPQIFRFDLPEKQRLDHPYFQRGFPAVVIQDIHKNAPETPTTGVPSADLARALWNFEEQFSTGLPTGWDKHYLFFDTPWGNIFISQQIYVFSLMGILSAILFYFIWRGRALREDLRSVIRSVWQLPISFFFLFLFLVLSTLTANQLMGIRLFDSFWTYNPLAVLALKFTLVLCLYFLFFLQIRRMPLSRWPGFYSYSTMLILTVEVLASAAVELSFSFYFLWALVFAVLFHTTKNRPLKLVFFALSPFWFLKAIVEIFLTNPDSVMIRLAVVSPLAGNLGLTMILFPFILLSNSFHYLRHQRQERNEKHRAQLVFLFWLLGAVAVGVFILRFNPFSTDRIPLTVWETQNLNDSKRTVRVQAPVAWDGLKLESGTDTLNLAKGQLLFSRDLPVRPRILEQTLTREAFLDRYIWHVGFQAQGAADQVTLTLTSDSPLVIYDCNFPFQLDNTGRTARIFVGQNPPPGLELRLTLAQTTTADLEFLVRYTHPPQAFHQEDGRYQVQSQLDVTGKIRLAP